MEAAFERHFFKHGGDQNVGATYAREIERMLLTKQPRQIAADSVSNCHWCQLRSFDTHERYPVSIVNIVDDAVLPSNFRFINQSILCDGVESAEPGFRSGCECNDAEECMYSNCTCLGEVIGDEDDPDGEDDDATDLNEADREILEWAQSTQKKPEWARQRGGRDGSKNHELRNTTASSDGLVAQRRKRFAYHSRGAKAGLLRGSKLPSRDPIYECHDACRCDKETCPNRVVEKGRQVPLQIFRTEDGRGWGVNALRELKRGQFVDRYFGEVITLEEANKRRNNSSMAQRKDVYLFALDKFTDPESQDPRLHEPREVDGEFMSGPTRFINHSCEPNLRIFARVGDHADKHIHDLALFAIRDIKKGEELTFDYVDGQEEIEGDAQNESMQGEMTKCLCGSKKCRGYLW